MIAPPLPPEAVDEVDVHEFLETQIAGVQRYEDPADCLAQLPNKGSVLFLLDARLARDAGLVWLTIFAETARGPILLIEEPSEQSLHEAALRAGAQGSLPRSAFQGSGGWVRPHFQLALDHFQRCSSARQTERALDVARLESARRDEREREVCERLERFVRDALHEFRTPLTAIGEFAGILSDGLAGELNERQLEYLAYVSEGVTQLVTAFDLYRDAMRMRLGLLPTHARPTPIDEIFEEVLATFREPKVHFDVQVGTDEVAADPEHLRTAVRAVLGFLEHTSPREGLVRVRQHAVDDDFLELRLKGNGPLPTESDVLLLRDGCLSEAGLSKSVARVFGLGMDLARGIVRRAGGSLDWVSSASDQTGSPILGLRLPRRVESRAD